MFLCPSTTPGRVSTSMSFIDFSLQLRKISDLLLRKLDVFDVTRRELGEAGFDFLLRETEILTIPIVEFHRQLADRRIASRLNIRKYLFDRKPDLCQIIGTRLCIPSVL